MYNVFLCASFDPCNTTPSLPPSLVPLSLKPRAAEQRPPHIKPPAQGASAENMAASILRLGSAVGFTSLAENQVRNVPLLDLHPHSW